MPRVVITGVGTINSLGNNVSEFWNRLSENKSGVSTYYNEYVTNVHVVASVKGDYINNHLTRKELIRTDRVTQLALISADEAIKDARLTQEDIVEGTILVGNAFGGTTSLLSNYKKALSGEPLSPFLITNFLSNTIGANIAIKYHVHGNNQAINTACASGTDAIGQGYERIMSGQYRIAIVGGSEASLTPLIINGFDKIGALSHSDDPSTASRPFDQERDGFVMGEGAGFLILENLENALERNAHILAEIVGYETNNDASNLLAPEPSAERISQMLNNLLVKAKIDKRSIDYVNTHGTSTKLNDSTEIKGLTRVFKGKK
ncbi:beta-ketoacyl-[acyl-carrier-protein] synthase family protein [Lactiplantibacillus plantarum]|nr:beta-ketoacyl-[acyl-carrier-protein] synthase family protein [Lactiplantibacillus plantarum]